MSWDAIGALGEIIGALAVVTSLVYVSIQIRQNTAALEVSTQQELVANQNAATEIIATNPEVASLWQKADDDYESLTAAEKKQYTFLCLTLFNVLQSARFNYEAGLLKEEIWQAWVRGYTAVVKSSPSMKKWWSESSDLYSPNVRTVIDEMF